MKKKVALTEISTANDLLINLTFHDIPATLIAEFAQKIVQPYYEGNLNRALKELMEKALAEQLLLQKHIIKT
jgi:tagatose-1,6-bisphosphate aldolase non-catalytic subunit AgaZ/GatZ